MSNYTKSTNFATKDNLTPGDPLKVVRGTEIDTEYNNIATAIATKTDNASAAITGGTIDGATVGATTPATGAFTTLAASGTTTLAGALVGAVTQAAFNTVSTTLNLGGAATAVNLGAATGTATVNNTTLAAKAITASTTLAVTGTSTLTGAVTATAGVSGPITSSSVSITGGSITGITDLAVADGGTGASTAATALNNLLPSQTGNASKYLQTDGTNATWDAVSLSTADITGTLGVANGGTGVTTSTGTTNVVLSNSPTLVTPTLGVATATSLQGIIGNVTPAAGSFTTLGASSTATLNTLSSSGATLTGGTINGMTVGATTASSGAFTTLTTSSTVTHNAGTANGVAFLNGSKVLTTGSVMTFDGTTFALGGGTNGSRFSVRGAGAIGGFDSGAAVDARVEYAYNGTNIFYTGMDSASLMTLMARSGVSLAFGANNSEQMRLTSTGLGIGTSSPGFKLDVQSAQAIVAATSTTTTNSTQYRAINGGGTFYIGLDSSTGGNFGTSGYGAVLWHTGNYPMVFATNNTIRATIDSAGNVGIGTSSPGAKLDVVGTIKGSTTIGVGAATPSTSGAGITFPATQSASSDANTLDDYEEGTCSLTVTSTSGTITTASAPSVYTKVGRSVLITGTVSVTTNGTGSGGLNITGLPFTPSSAACGVGRESINNGKTCAFMISNTSTTMNVLAYDNTYPVSSGSVIQFSVTYIT